MNTQTKTAIKIQSIWRSYRMRNLRKYMQVKKCNDCNIYTKLYPLTTSELESKIFTCWNCFDIPRNPTVTCIVDDNDIEGLKYMKQFHKKKTINISRTPTATCVFDDNDVNGIKYMEKIYTNNIFDKEFLDNNKDDDSSVFGEYHKAGMTF
jgi:hypothetical protein